VCGSKFVAVLCGVEPDELRGVILIVIEEVHYGLEAGTEPTGGYYGGCDGIRGWVRFDSGVLGT